MKHQQSRWSISVVMVLLVSSSWYCSPERTDQVDTVEETPTSGQVTIYCDDAIAALFQPLVDTFNVLYPEATVTLQPIAARQAVGKLFQGEARAVILCREYLSDEDSLLAAHNVHFPRVVFAKDALVFYAHPEFPLDTISDVQLRAVFRDGTTLEQLFQLSTPIEIVVPDQYSSVYANLTRFFTDGQPLRFPVKMLPNVDSVYQYVTAHPTALGVGYLSQVALDTTVKMIRIGFVDSTGSYVYPTRYPHQTLIVMKLYPYVVPIYGILREDIRNLPWGVFMFLERDPLATQHYKDKGIVPTFAVIRIKTMGE